MNFEIKIPIPAVIGALVVLLGAWLYWGLSGGSDARPLDVHYPYWCKDCKAIFDVAELKAPGKWRMPKGALSDSIVYCVRCNKGWAYPVARCPKCGQNYVLHLQEDVRCPNCNPQAAQEAAQAGIDLAPPEVRALKITPQK